MTDFINQGKGPINSIWKTTNFKKLREFYQRCCEDKIDFYNPPDSYKDKLINDLGGSDDKRNN